MPIYEYKCEHCGDTFEILQKVNEEPLNDCIICHKGPVKKLMSVSSFVLKGAGFYVNDYPSASRSKGHTAKKEKSSSSKSKESSTTSAGTSKEKDTKKAD